MRAVFMGTPEFAIPSLRACGQAGLEVVAVVTRPDRPRRRQSEPPQPSPVGREAMALGLPVLTPASMTEPGVREQIAGYQPDVIVVVAFGRLLPPDILRIPPRWCINLHASILPKYRGAAPIARAILAGEKVTGVTTMRMDKGLDTGDILLQRECAIGLTETTGELTARLAHVGAELLAETLAKHRLGALEPRRQESRDAIPAPPLTKEDGRIEWSQGAEAIACRIRACNPWPLAVAALRGEPVQLLRAEVDFATAKPGRGRRAPGEVLVARGDRIVVQCRAEGRLSILDLRFPGGRTMTARDAINGRLVRTGDLFAQAPPG